MMTKGVVATLMAVASGLSVVGAASAAPTCMATCNEHNIDCGKGGKSQEYCLGVWHQCKTSCSTPPTLTVKKTGPNSVSIKATPGPTATARR